MLSLYAALVHPSPPARWRDTLPYARRERFRDTLPTSTKNAVLSAYALGHKLACDIASETLWLELAYTEQGKPFFPGAPRLHFSLSHSRDYVFCALSDAPVGCDVERLRRISPALCRRLLGGAFHPEEPMEPIRAFCAREASFKRRGGSIWDSPADCAFYPLPDACACLSSKTQPDSLPLYDYDHDKIIGIYEREGFP